MCLGKAPERSSVLTCTIMNTHNRNIRAWGVQSGLRVRVRCISKLRPPPAEEVRARGGQSLSSSWTRSFLPSEPGIQNGERMLALSFLSWCLFYSGNSLCLALSSCNVTNYSLPKGIKVLQTKGLNKDLYSWWARHPPRLYVQMPRQLPKSWWSLHSSQLSSLSPELYSSS